MEVPLQRPLPGPALTLPLSKALREEEVPPRAVGRAVGRGRPAHPQRLCLEKEVAFCRKGDRVDRAEGPARAKGGQGNAEGVWDRKGLRAEGSV